MRSVSSRYEAGSLRAHHTARLRDSDAAILRKAIFQQDLCDVHVSHATLTVDCG